MLNDICKVCKCNICLLISAFCLFYRSVCVSSVTHDTYTFSTHADGRIPGKHFHLWPFDLVFLSSLPSPFTTALDTLPSPSCSDTANVSMHLFFTFHSVNLLIQYLYTGSLNQTFYPADNRIIINEVSYFLVNATVENSYWINIFSDDSAACCKDAHILNLLFSLTHQQFSICSCLRNHRKDSDLL